MSTDPEALRVQARVPALNRLTRLLTVVAAAVAVVALIAVLGDLLVLVFAAALLAVILHGVSARVTRWTRLPYLASLALVALLLVAAIVGLGFSSGPGFADQLVALRGALLSQAEALRGRLAGTTYGDAILDQVPSAIGGNKDGGLATLSAGMAGRVAGALNAALGLFGTLGVIAITALYFAAAPASYLDGALRLVPPAGRRRARELAEAAGKALWAWSAGQALDMLVVGLVSGVGLWLLGVPLAPVLGVIAGLFNFVPYIGAIVGAVPAVIIAFSQGTTVGLETVALYVVIQTLEGNVLAPLIQNRAVSMPPALTILAQTVFGAVLGFSGLVLATPMTAALMAVLDNATPPLDDADRVPLDEG